MANEIEDNKIKIVIKNYKQFKDKTEIILAPLTILVGPNGGGKSSIISAIQLMTLSIQYLLRGEAEARKHLERIPFDEVISVNNQKQKGFSLAIADKKGECIKIEFKKGKNGGIKIKFFIIRITIMFGNVKDGVEERIEYLKISPDKFIEYRPKEIKKIEEELQNVKKYLGYGGNGLARLYRIVQKMDPNSEFKFIKTEIKSSEFVEQEGQPDVLEILVSSYFTQLYGIEPISDRPGSNMPTIYWATILLALEKENFDSIQSDYASTFKILDTLLAYVKEDIERLAEFLFNKLDDTRKDPPEYFEYKNGLFQNDYYELCDYLLNGTREISTDPNNQQTKKENFFKHVQNFQIADTIVINELVKLKPDQKLFEVLLEKDKVKFNLKNLSSGGKQILPVLLKLFVQLSPFENLMISQPELHLHPRLQGIIADVVVDFFSDTLISAKQKILIETHSEHIIRKLQVLVAQRKINNEFISIYYVNPGNKPFESQAVYLPMNDKGLFTESWPNGFFNDTTILSLELIEELSKRQN
jgi:predicted ATPase